VGDGGLEGVEFGGVDDEEFDLFVVEHLDLYRRVGGLEFCV
jgi:hypothetical protein